MYNLEGLTPFHLAISNNLQHCVEEIVAASPDIIHLPTLSGLMPLMLAAHTGSIGVCGINLALLHIHLCSCVNSFLIMAVIPMLLMRILFSQPYIWLQREVTVLL